ncbi:Cobalt transport protein [Calothrix sp. PCC 7716]|nr:Cobalt transport protein [Calothrix sp. PCC 7716]
MKIQIDQLAYTNRLRWLPPEHKLTFATTLFLITFFSHPTVQILIAVWMSIWIVIYAGISAKVYLKLLYVALFFWLTSLFALVFNIVASDSVANIQNDALAGLTIGFFHIYISFNGILQGLSILTRALASLSCLYFVMLTIPFSELLEVLRRIGLPELLCEILLLMYRFIFVLLNTASQLWTAQQARFGYRTFNTSIKSLGLLVGQLFKRTLENYRQVSLSLESRGFNGQFRVWHPYRYRPSKRYAIEAIIGSTILLGLELLNHARIYTRV